jgi:hypothetical protein
MPNTRAKTYDEDNKIDFDRKDKDNDKVIIKKWGDPDYRFLDQYFNNKEKRDNLNNR